MVTGELPTRPLINVDSEIVSLFDRPNCPKPTNFPIENSLAYYGILFEDDPLICAFNGQENGCFRYQIYRKEWSLEVFAINKQRTHASGVHYGNNSWIISGGHIFQERIPLLLSTSEVLKNQMFDFGPMLPIPLSGHCSVALDERQIFIGGGYGNLKDSFILDVSEKTWTNLTLMKYGKFGHACGRVYTLFNEMEVIVAGGLHQNIIEHFSIKRSNWFSGPTINQPIYRVATIQGETTFLITGGVELEPGCSTINCRLNTILKYDNYVEDFSKEKTLSQGRGNHIAIPLPADIECSGNIL